MLQKNSQTLGITPYLLIAFVAGSCRAPAPNATEPFFPILPWELGKQSQLADSHQGISTLADCGFTTVAFVRPNQLPRCEKLRLKAIVCPERWQIKWRELSDQQIVDTVAKLVKESGNSQGTP